MKSHAIPAPRPPADPIEELDPQTLAFYHRAMDVMDAAGVEFLVGGAYSLAQHAGIVRHTKDFDVFVRATDRDPALAALRGAGYRTELTFPHWLGKAFEADAFVDVIFASGNGICKVDDEWFDNAIDGKALGRPAKICPAEEVIWSKCFVMERERFDGADVNHVLLARGRELDWDRLLRRFRGHERVLLGHLMFFGYAFPAERGNVPQQVIDELMRRANDEPSSAEKVCRGTSISREQYLIDVHRRGYRDARLQPQGPLTEEEVSHWTAAISTHK